MANDGQCQVRFEVSCDATQPGDHVKVVGSEAVLGSWRPEASTVVLGTTPDNFPKWSSEWVGLPANAEYKYVIVGGQQPRWEKCSDRQLPTEVKSCSDRRATITEEFGKSGACNVSLENSQRAAVRSASFSLIPEVRVEAEITIIFEVRCSTKPGEELRVVGSPDVLGAWSPSASKVVLSTTSSEYPVWISQPQNLMLTDGLEFKFVVCRDGIPVRWEGGKSNRQLAKDLAHAADGVRYKVAATFDRMNECIISRLPWSPKQVVNDPTVTRMCARRRSTENANNFGLLSPKLSLKRRGTWSCTSELPQGVLPTSRNPIFQSTESGMDTLAREAMCTQLKETNQKGIVARNRRASKMITQKEAFTPVTPATTCASPTNRRRFGFADDDSLSEDEANSQTIESETDSKDFVKAADEDGSTGDGEGDGEGEDESFDMAYELYEKLGEGAFGVVYRCSRRSTPEAKLAAKVIQLGQMEDREKKMLLGDKESGLEGEVAIHKSIPHHDLIVGLLHCFEERHAVTMVLDYCEGGDLFDVICAASQVSQSIGRGGALQQRAGADVVRQVLTALAFCHAHDVVHRDVKPENILVDRRLPAEALGVDAPLPTRVRLCDFGMAARCPADKEELADLCGSPDYVAQEVVRKQRYGQKVDVWSAGALLFAVLRGKTPFAAASDGLVIKNVVRGHIQFDAVWSTFRPSAGAAVDSMLTRLPHLRPSAAEAMSLDFFREAAVDVEPDTGGSSCS
eukprot:TRINITY_DN683_c2_g1_i2.p1 TRINITY_DN683_c2_g1~~TRINITY_DN683_c2_g1_i2.p1  ORF type:complete len:740 (+),score=121.02 TRINITY_DN683_c2_g1_i2:609-2828(+)